MYVENIRRLRVKPCGTPPLKSQMEELELSITTENVLLDNKSRRLVGLYL